MTAGSFFFCLREGFRATGGFSEKVYAGEEIWFSRELKRWGIHRGFRFVIFILLNLVFPFAAVSAVSVPYGTGGGQSTKATNLDTYLRFLSG